MVLLRSERWNSFWWLRTSTNANSPLFQGCSCFSKSLAHSWSLPLSSEVTCYATLFLSSVVFMLRVYTKGFFASTTIAVRRFEQMCEPPAFQNRLRNIFDIFHSGKFSCCDSQHVIIRACSHLAQNRRTTNQRAWSETQIVDLSTCAKRFSTSAPAVTTHAKAHERRVRRYTAKASRTNRRRRLMLLQ